MILWHSNDDSAGKLSCPRYGVAGNIWHLHFLWKKNRIYRPHSESLCRLSGRKHLQTPKDSPEILRCNFWCNKNFQKWNFGWKFDRKWAVYDQFWSYGWLFRSLANQIKLSMSIYGLLNLNGDAPPRSSKDDSTVKINLPWWTCSWCLGGYRPFHVRCCL